MIGLYLHKSNIPITVENVRKEIISITKTVIEDGGLPNSGLIFPSSKRGSFQMSIPKVVLTRTMNMVSDTNCSLATQLLDPNDGWSYRLYSERLYINGGYIFFVLQKNITFGIIKIFPL